MKPQTVGRVLGVGLRVAGRVAGQRLAASGGTPASSAAGVAPVQQDTGARARQAGAKAARVSGGVARGMGGFLRPFRRVGGILFLEVVGGFFLLFVMVFSIAAWRLRSDYAHGPEHAKFLVSAGMAVVFLYLGLSSFWRANRR
ncbi:MAG TPA: hypothetical protein VMD29_09780 [Terracidiphilus sp.]|nr:hypothetical protein [Terracidiphilus sp.]